MRDITITLPARDLVRARNILSKAWRADLIEKPHRLSIARVIEAIEKQIIVGDVVDSIDNEDEEE